jgi:tRNA (Thr-GGU) A37 N-methylase
MDGPDKYSLWPIGLVHSTLQHREDSPRQGLEVAPEAWIEIFPDFIEALEGITPNSDVVQGIYHKHCSVLHRADGYSYLSTTGAPLGFEKTGIRAHEVS